MAHECYQNIEDVHKVDEAQDSSRGSVETLGDASHVRADEDKPFWATQWSLVLMDGDLYKIRKTHHISIDVILKAPECHKRTCFRTGNDEIPLYEDILKAVL